MSNATASVASALGPIAIPAGWPAHLSQNTLWAALGRNFLTLSNWSYSKLGGCLTHTLFSAAVFWPTYIAFYSFHRAIDKQNLFGLRKYKLHPDKSEPQELNDKVTSGLWKGWWKGVLRTAAVYWIFFSHGRQNMTNSFPTLTKLLTDSLVSLLLNDFLFYWFHRIEHMPYFYKTWHKQHHEFKITNVGATSWNNPSESFGIMVIANVIAMGLKYDLFTWCFNIIIGVWADFQVHVGYELPFNPMNILIPPKYHDYHHYQNMGMYSTGGVWDWLFGTDKNYKSYMKRQEERKAQGLAEEAERRGDDGDTDESTGYVAKKDA